MRRSLIALAALLIALTLWIPLHAAGAGAAANPAPATNDHILRIGVVRVGQIYHSMQEGKKFESEFRNRRSQLQQDQQKRTEELNQLVAQREQLKPGSAQWNDIRRQIDEKSAQLDIANKMAQLELDRFRKASVKQAYDHISEAAASVAQQQHIDLVIADSSPEFIGPDLDAIPYAQLDQMLASRAVLFANKKADITEDVLTLVDASFAKQSPGISTTGNK
jgi:Skp family chaperone for outer membrane proteins